MMDANPFPTSNTDLGIISTKAIFGHRVVDFAFFYQHRIGKLVSRVASVKN